MSDQPPFKIEGTKVWLSAEARQMAALSGLSDEQMGRHLLSQAKLREQGAIQRDGHDGA
jgi:hypothetical protein